MSDRCHDRVRVPCVPLPMPNVSSLKGAAFVGNLTPRAHHRMLDGHPSSRGGGNSAGNVGAAEQFVPDNYPEKMNWRNFNRDAEASRMARRAEVLEPLHSLPASSDSGSCSVALAAAALDEAVADVSYRCEGHFLENGGHEETWTLCLNSEAELLCALSRLRAALGRPCEKIDVAALGRALESDDVGVTFDDQEPKCGESNVWVTLRHKGADGSVTSSHRATFRRVRAALMAFASTSPPDRESLLPTAHGESIASGAA